MKNSNNICTNFKGFLLEDFLSQDDSQFQPENFKKFLNFILERNLIESQNIKRYTVLKTFEEQYPLHHYHKTQTVYTIANKYNLSERSVWTVLKDHVLRFRKRVHS